MLKQILGLDGVQKLSREHLKSINGGVDKCCIRVPTNGKLSITHDPRREHCRTPQCRNAACCRKYN